jgi:hypothetical protein
MYSINSIQRARMNKKYLNIKQGTLLLLALILFCGCVGDQQRVNNKKDNEQKKGESYRDRTPKAPRINIPAHNF